LIILCLYVDTLVVGSIAELKNENTWQEKYAIVSCKTGRVMYEGDAELVWVNYKESRRAPMPSSVLASLGIEK
jgi:acyl-CoA thioesterase FadM